MGEHPRPHPSAGGLLAHVGALFPPASLTWHSVSGTDTSLKRAAERTGTSPLRFARNPPRYPLQVAAVPEAQSRHRPEQRWGSALG